MDHPMVQTRQLTRIFTRAKPPKLAVEHVDLVVGADTIYGLIGRPGSRPWWRC